MRASYEMTITLVLLLLLLLRQNPAIDLPVPNMLPNLIVQLDGNPPDSAQNSDITEAITRICLPRDLISWPVYLQPSPLPPVSIVKVDSSRAPPR